MEQLWKLLKSENEIKRAKGNKKNRKNRNKWWKFARIFILLLSLTAFKYLKC